MTNAIELIKADHRTVEHLYHQYQGLNGQTHPKQAIIQEICQALKLHAQLEEEIFYPAVARQLGKEGARLVQEALQEHSEMKRAISQLQMSKFAGPECEHVFQQMMTGVQHHVKEEESEMLPQAQQQLWAESERLGRQMQQYKQALQTTQPASGNQPQEVQLNK